MHAREHTQSGPNLGEEAFSSPTSLLFYSSSNLKFGARLTSLQINEVFSGLSHAGALRERIQIEVPQ